MIHDSTYLGPVWASRSLSQGKDHFGRRAFLTVVHQTLYYYRYAHQCQGHLRFMVIPESNCIYIQISTMKWMVDLWLKGIRIFHVLLFYNGKKIKKYVVCHIVQMQSKVVSCSFKGNKIFSFEFCPIEIVRLFLAKLGKCRITEVWLMCKGLLFNR